MTFQIEHLNGDASGRHLEILRSADEETYDALIEAMPWLADHLETQDEFAQIVELLTQVATEESAIARVLANRLITEPQIAADSIGLRKWVIHGVKEFKNNPKNVLANFQWGNPLIFCDSKTENDSEFILENREAMLHYLGGFGCVRHGIELHEPQPLEIPQPAPAVSEEIIYMPRRCEGVEDYQRSLFYRASMAHIAAHLKFSRQSRLTGNRRPMLLAMTSLIEDARVERLMVLEYPGLKDLWGIFHVATKESAGFKFEGLAARLARALHDPEYQDSNSWVERGRKLFEENAGRDLHDIEAFDRVARELSINMGRMRLTIPTYYRPSPLYRDDNSLLWNTKGTKSIDEELPVIDEIEFRQRVDDDQEIDISDIDLRRRFRYPEWDQKLESLREDWVTVIEGIDTSRIAQNAIRKESKAIRNRIRGLERTPDRSIKLNRLSEGDEIDINAAIDCAVLRKARISPDGRVFSRHGRRRRATAVILLMDLSQSTNRFVPGSFTTVMDVEKRAARIVAEALDERRDRVAIHGFSSNGRHEVNYLRIKNFDEPFGDAQRERLGTLKGGLSTRMGAALRHASADLDRETADHKVILIMTDGEPSDIDVVEDDYLVEDARHAVAAAASRGIRTFCLTLDRRADEYVRKIFGSRNYLISDKAETFAGRAGQTLVRLAAQ